MADINSGFYGLPGGDIRVQHGSDESHFVTFTVTKTGMSSMMFTEEKQAELKQSYATLKSVDKERITLTNRTEPGGGGGEEKEEVVVEFTIADFPTAIDAEDFAERCEAAPQPLGSEW